MTFSCPGGHSWGDYGMPAAIDQMIAFLSELKQSYLVKEGHNTGGVSFNTGTVNGGEGINSISRHAETTFEFRSVSSDVLDELHNVVERLVSSINTRDDVDAVCEITGERPAGSSVMPERVEPVITSLLNDIGEPSESVPRSTNINVPLHEGWPSVCIGICRGGRYHSADEYVELESLPKGWEFLLKMTEHFMM